MKKSDDAGKVEDYLPVENDNDDDLLTIGDISSVAVDGKPPLSEEERLKAEIENLRLKNERKVRKYQHRQEVAENELISIKKSHNEARQEVALLVERNFKFKDEIKSLKRELRFKDEKRRKLEKENENLWKEIDYFRKQDFCSECKKLKELEDETTRMVEEAKKEVEKQKSIAESYEESSKATKKECERLNRDLRDTKRQLASQIKENKEIPKIKTEFEKIKNQLKEALIDNQKLHEDISRLEYKKSSKDDWKSTYDELKKDYKEKEDARADLMVKFMDSMIDEDEVMKKTYEKFKKDLKGIYEKIKKLK